MRLLKQWVPWKFLITRAARAHGIIDPLGILARVRQFSQPSEVQEPIELLRAGIIFHARGLINTKAIQHNLDWIWPYWVERQFNPNCSSFIPRAFSFSHVNLTHRNWTAVGHPNLPHYPIVDPRGLVTPLFDGWSLDFWMLRENGDSLFPSRLDSAIQKWDLRPNPTVITRLAKNGLGLETRVDLVIREGIPTVRIQAEGVASDKAWLVVALRPYNPEGIQFVERIKLETTGLGLLVNRSDRIEMNDPPARTVFSTYDEGDVLNRIWNTSKRTQAECRVGMATAAMLFAVGPGRNAPVTLHVPIPRRRRKKPLQLVETAWETTLAGAARLRIPDAHFRFLYDAALHTLVLLSAEEIVPGPYTYRRFWFRDACLMLNAMLGVNLTQRSRRILNSFPSRRKWNGYFQSQTGEWDSNGQVLWIMDRFQRLTGQVPDEAWLKAVSSGADWIVKKRLPEDSGKRHGGLLPPGFSAEHLGPNDYYYWDDFWGVAGLRAAARLLSRFEDASKAERFSREADSFEQAINASIDSGAPGRPGGSIPAAPYRRMDAGAVGSLVADYPLCLSPPADPRIMATVDFLMQNCFHQGAFFQDMIHSGVNAYLTLDIAQTLLRAEDARWRPLVDRVAQLATDTGQWPEAVHPRTGGGCMGDGQHGWAAAEWLMMMRSLFVREEENHLIIGSGIASEWLTAGETLSFGPTPTPAGTLTVEIEPIADRVQVRIDCERVPDEKRKFQLMTAIPGYQRAVLTSDALSQPVLIELEKK